MEGLGLRLVTNRLDIVAVGSDDVRGVVVGMILLSYSRGSIVLPARRDCSGMKLADLLSVRGGEGNMDRPRAVTKRADP